MPALSRRLALASLLAVSFVPLAGVSHAASPPKRAPGLWETATITNDGRTVAKECVDARTDRLVRQAMAGLTCRNDDFNRTAEGGWMAGAICNSGGMKIDNKVVVSGDFSNFASAEATTVMTGSSSAGVPKSFRTLIEARRLGDCAPGQRPGDVILSDGTVINVPGGK